jgi:hypothetical protein
MTLIPQPAVAALTSGAREQFLRSLLTNPVTNLTSDQAMAQLGGSIPLVWGRRDATDDSEGEVGGVWVAPVATELRFENDEDNNLIAYYHLVLSQGQVSSVQVGEFWQGAQERGSLQQAYGARAGSWTPGNALQQRYRVETLRYQTSVSGQAWTAWNPAARRNYTIEEFNQSIRANITLTSRGNFVTSFLVEPVKNLVQQAFTGALTTSSQFGQSEASASFNTGLYYLSESPRYLPGYTYSASPSTTENRFSISLQEEGIDYWKAILNGYTAFQPPATYTLNITETNTIPLPIADVANYCGTGGGSYYDLSTASFSCLHASGSAEWRQQVWVFLRGGAHASRLIELGTGPSPWLPDLARYLMRSTERVTDDQIDADSLALAARFNQAMGLRFNGELRSPVNLRDFLGRVAPLFLLEVQDRGGRLGLVPAHPVNNAYRLDTDPITPQLTLNESHIVPGSFNPEWIGAADRQRTSLIITYRAQPANQPAYDRVLEVRGSTSGEAGPFETLDLREFCCSYRHALVVGLWRQARRNYITHRLRGLQILPEYDSDVLRLLVGSVVRVDYPRIPSIGDPSVHSYLYTVQDIRTAANGQTTLDLEHFPVNHDDRSLVALDVMGQLPTAEPPRLRAGAQMYAPTVGSGVLIRPEPLRAGASANVMTDAVGVVMPMLTIGATVGLVYRGDFNPALLSPAAWWKADASSSITVIDGKVSAISDLSGNGFDLIQATSADRPTYVSSALNGKAAMRWPSTANRVHLYRNGSNTLTVAEVYIVAKFAATEFAGFEGLFGPGGGGSAWIIGGYQSQSFYTSGPWSEAYVNNSSTNTFTSILPALASPCIIRLPLSSGTVSTTSIRLGMDRDYLSLDRGWRDDIYEVIPFSRVLNSTERANLITYLSSYYAITVS